MLVVLQQADEYRVSVTFEGVLMKLRNCLLRYIFTILYWRGRITLVAALGRKHRQTLTVRRMERVLLSSAASCLGRDVTEDEAG